MHNRLMPAALSNVLLNVSPLSRVTRRNRALCSLVDRGQMTLEAIKQVLRKIVAGEQGGDSRANRRVRDLITFRRLIVRSNRLGRSAHSGQERLFQMFCQFPDKSVRTAEQIAQRHLFDRTFVHDSGSRKDTSTGSY